MTKIKMLIPRIHLCCMYNVKHVVIDFTLFEQWNRHLIKSLQVRHLRPNEYLSLHRLLVKLPVHKLYLVVQCSKLTPHLSRKKLSTNSPWDFEHVFETMDDY